MNIVLRNIGSGTVTIADLAIQLEPENEVDLMAYQSRDLLSSTDLPLAFSGENIEIKINNVVSNYPTMVAKLTNLTAADHETIPTLKHNVSENYFFETAKNASGQTEFITYYTDSSKMLKIREEEIIRGATGNVSEIIVREYDPNGNIVSTERQILNRTTDGKVGNITVEKT